MLRFIGVLSLFGLAQAIGCISWRNTGQCDPNGPREEHLDRHCNVLIPSTRSGYCECEGGLRTYLKNCGDTTYYNCKRACDDYGYSCYSWNNKLWKGQSCAGALRHTPCGCATCTPCGTCEENMCSVSSGYTVKQGVGTPICNGGRCRTECCERTCNTCTSRYVAKASQNPENCEGSGPCAINDAACCEMKSCNTCNNGYVAKASQNPRYCAGSGHCAINDAACCEKRECNTCNNGYVTKAIQAPESCAGAGACAINDAACCEDACLNGCDDGFLAKVSPAPQSCGSGRCPKNSEHCCYYAPKPLIVKGVQQPDVHITAQYKLSFKLTPYRTKPEKTNIVHVTATGADLGSGGRTPAVFFEPDSTTLTACTGCVGNDNLCVSAPEELPLDELSSVLVTVDHQQLSLLVNGTEVASADCETAYQPQPDDTAQLWTSDSWHEAAYGHLEAVKYHQRRVTGWQNEEPGMSCTSHRLYMGDGISKADCQKKCEENALCRSIFYTTTGRKSCTLCPEYSPQAARRLDLDGIPEDADQETVTEIYTDQLTEYKMRQYRREHLVDVKWFSGGMFTCSNMVAPSIDFLSKELCEELAQSVGQTLPLPEASLKSGCMMDKEGTFSWSDVVTDIFPAAPWDAMLLCKFDPSADGLETFSPVISDPDMEPSPSFWSSEDSHNLEIDVEPMQLMRVWIARRSDEHVQLGQTADYEGTTVSIQAFNGNNWESCNKGALLDPNKQWTRVVCDSSVYAEKIRIESDTKFEPFAETRVQGVEAHQDFKDYESKYSWTGQISTEYYEVPDHRTCTAGAVYHTQGCFPGQCETTAKAKCDADWKHCWGFAIQTAGWLGSIEFYTKGAQNPDECDGHLGLKHNGAYNTYRRRTIQMQDVLVLEAPCWKYNWYLDTRTYTNVCLDRHLEFEKEMVPRLQKLRSCTFEDTLEDTLACYREMAFMDTIGPEMAELFKDRKEQTASCNQGDRRLANDTSDEMRRVETEDTEYSNENLPTDNQIEYLKSLIAAEKAKNSNGRRRTERLQGQRMEILDASAVGFAPAPYGGAPEPVLARFTKLMRRSAASGQECRRRANVLNSLACNNLKKAAAISLETMKMRQSIAIDEGKLLDSEAASTHSGGLGGFFAGLFGGASAHAAGGPAGVALSVASSFVGGMTSLFTGFADGIITSDHASLARREAHAIRRDIAAHNAQTLSDKVQVCDMPSTSDLQCQLGDIEDLQRQGLMNQAKLLTDMTEGFEKMDENYKNLMRVLGDNHIEVLRNFHKVHTVLAAHGDQLESITDILKSLTVDVQNNQQLLFFQSELIAINEAREWYDAWRNDETRFNKFKKNDGASWCTEFGETFNPNIVDHIEHWVSKPVFFDLIKASMNNLGLACTRENLKRRYTEVHHSFEQLFDFAASMSLYYKGFSKHQVDGVMFARETMAEVYSTRIAEIIDENSAALTC